MPSPQPASRDVKGSLPARAAQRCNPITAASAFGWYIYPPADFALRWDGDTSEWALLQDNQPVEWWSLDGGHDSPLPLSRQVIADVPAGRRADLDIFEKFGDSIPFVNADPRAPNTLELTIGLLARTAPGWWLLVRDAPNWPGRSGHQVLEGIVESDWYASFLPTVVRLTTPNRIVRFYRDLPIMAVQPVRADTLQLLKEPVSMRRGIADFPPDVWHDFVEWRRNVQNPETRKAFKRQKRAEGRRAREADATCPVDHTDPSGPDDL